MISFDTSLLTSYYASKTRGTTASAATVKPADASPTGTTRAPTAPWEGGSKESEEIKAILSGKKFIRESSTTLDLAGASADYKKLYTLYSGLSSLRAVASKSKEILDGANPDSITNTTQLNTLRRRFESGLGEVSSYIKDAGYEHLDFIQGTITDKLKSTVGIARTDATYFAKDIHSGTATQAVAALQGDVKFDISVKRIGTATPFNVSIDLNEMGTDVRSMSNVVNYINSKLKAEGVNTKFEVQRTPAVPTTSTINGKTVTLSKGQDTFSLKIKGDTTEALTFSAPQTDDAVFMVQTVGDTDKKMVYNKETKKFEEKTGVQTTEMVKFQTDSVGADGEPLAAPGDTFWSAGRSVQNDMAENITKVHQTVSGEDGSVYVLADVNGTIEGQTIKGTQDTALIKYDSAGNVVYARTLGAAESATGYSLAVSDDGRVAVAGSVTGSLPTVTTKSTSYTVNGETFTTTKTTADSGTTGSNPTVADSFVTVFNAAGEEEWTKRRGATLEDTALGVTFGDDGSVYVTGKARSQVLGATGAAQGGWDAYVMGYDNAGTFKFANQFGSAGTDMGSAVTVEGNTLYVAANEDSQMVLRAYDISSGSAVLSGTRALGGMGGGEITALEVHDGKVYVGGSTGNGNLLSPGAVTRAYSGGQDAFAAAVSTDFGDASGDKVAYYGGSGTEKSFKVAFDEGKAYFAGQTEGEIAGTTKIGEADAFISRVDVNSGGVEWAHRYTGKDGEVNPNAMAISKGGASVLDRLGLPQGTIEYRDSTLITSGTSVRAGDSFSLRDPRNGLEKKIVIEANETLETLARKITRAAGFTIKATVAKIAGKPQSQLVLEPATKSAQMEFVKGPTGRDALEGLGLNEGLVTNALKTEELFGAKKTNRDDEPKLTGLNFNTDIRLNSTESIDKALKTLDDALKNVRAAYRYLRYGDDTSSDDPKKNTSGSVPSYLTNQISNYQAALQRLTGGA